MEKLRHSNSSLNTINTFDRFFSKARGVELFPEEKDSILKKLQEFALTPLPEVIVAEKIPVQK